MNKSFILLILVSIFIVGCGRAPEKKEIVAKINNYELTKDKFETEFKESIYGRTDTPQARKDFLDNLINRKLILQDAQRKDLDKEPNFLSMIEKFWEQSLLKIALDKKAEEIAGSTSVSEAQIRRLYDAKFESGQIDKPYEQVREQLKREMIRFQESQEMNDWITQLDKKAQIKINYELLNQK